MLRFLSILITFHLVFFSTLSIGETPSHHGSLTFRTPYDTKYREVETYLSVARTMTVGSWSPSFSTQENKIRHYLSMAQNFSFQEEALLSTGVYEDHWQLPEETERVGGGDCEDLAIWLYCHLLDEGFHNVRFTVGLAGGEEKTMHAWVTWYEKGKMYILDPSRRKGIYTSNPSGSIAYDPKYSYYFDKKWNHH